MGFADRIGKIRTVRPSQLGTDIGVKGQSLGRYRTQRAE